MLSFRIRCPSASSWAARVATGPRISYNTFCNLLAWRSGRRGAGWLETFPGLACHRWGIVGAATLLTSGTACVSQGGCMTVACLAATDSGARVPGPIRFGGSASSQGSGLSWTSMTSDDVTEEPVNPDHEVDVA